MKKTIRLLFFCLLLSNGVQTVVPSDHSKYRDEVDYVLAQPLLLKVAPDTSPQTSLLPAIQTIRTDTKLAGVSSAHMKQEVVKADFDGDDGQVDWKTVLIVLCVAFLVYWINRSKRRDID